MRTELHVQKNHISYIDTVNGNVLPSNKYPLLIRIAAYFPMSERLL